MDRFGQEHWLVFATAVVPREVDTNRLAVKNMKCECPGLG